MVFHLGFPAGIPQAQNPGGTFTIDRSLRFNVPDSPYLHFMPGSAGNQLKWTYSGWIKRGNTATGINQTFFGAANGTAGNYLQAYFDGATHALGVTAQNSLSVVVNKISSTVFTDVSVWHHVVIAFDSANTTSADRVRIYVDGVRITSFSTNIDPGQNVSTFVNTTQQHTLSSLNYTSRLNYFDGYMAEVHFVDGQALGPTDFGEDTGSLWVPKEYLGTHGTNGCYLDFSDNTSTTTMGQDAAGSNNWTLSGMTTADSSTDTPTSS